MSANNVETGVISILKRVYPVGSIYIAVIETNPATTLGFGTWTAFGAGKVMVGQDTGYAPFDSMKESGGSLTHTLSEAEMPSHSHVIQGGAKTTAWEAPNLVASYQYQAAAHTNISVSETTGSGSAHNNVQPFIVVKMWERTA